MSRNRYNFITMPPGQLLSKYDIPLAGWKVLASSIKRVFVIVGHTNLLWLYSSLVLYLRLRGEFLKVAKSRPEPEHDMPIMLPAELVLTTRDLFSGVEALKSAGRSRFVK